MEYFKNYKKESAKLALSSTIEALQDALQFDNAISIVNRIEEAQHLLSAAKRQLQSKKIRVAINSNSD